MHDDVHVGVYVKVAILEGACEGEYERNVVIRSGFSGRGDCGGASRGEEWMGWDAAGQRSVVVHVKLEEMEEFVRYGGDGAVGVFFNTEKEVEGSIGFITGREGDILQLASRVGYMLPRINRSVQAADGYSLPKRIAGLFIQALFGCCQG